MATGQSFQVAVSNTCSDPKSLAIIGASTLIGAATSGLSGIAVEAAAKTSVSVAAIAVKTVAINTASGAIDAAAKDVTTKAISGKPQSLKDTAKVALNGAGSALIASGATQSVIARGSAKFVSTFSNDNGVKAGTEILQPKWAGSVGVVGESVIPTAVDVTKSLMQ